MAGWSKGFVGAGSSTITSAACGTKIVTVMKCRNGALNCAAAVPAASIDFGADGGAKSSAGDGGKVARRNDSRRKRFQRRLVADELRSSSTIQNFHALAVFGTRRKPFDGDRFRLPYFGADAHFLPVRSADDWSVAARTYPHMNDVAGDRLPVGEAARKFRRWDPAQNLPFPVGSAAVTACGDPKTVVEDAFAGRERQRRRRCQRAQPRATVGKPLQMKNNMRHQKAESWFLRRYIACHWLVILEVFKHANQLNRSTQPLKIGGSWHSK